MCSSRVCNWRYGTYWANWRSEFCDPVRPVALNEATGLGVLIPVRDKLRCEAILEHFILEASHSYEADRGDQGEKTDT